MSDYSTIAVGQTLQEYVDGHWEKSTGGKYYLSIDLLPKGRNEERKWSGDGRYEFSHKFTDPFLLFIELAGKEQNVLLRLGNAEGDKMSFDMFSHFKLGKKELLEDDYCPTVKYKKSLFGDDFERFGGFSPFGFTLIQPSFESSYEWLSQRFVYGVYRRPRELGTLRREILELRIYNRNFNRVRISLVSG